ncbi:MAG TPA: 30S ribosomal protein S2 [Candidatus Paceibacterota bacterium]
MEANLIEKLFGVGAHYGLNSSRRHPATKRFLFGQKGGVELFDLEKTANLLNTALEAIAALAKERKTILFVGGQAQAREAVQRTAEGLGQPFVASRWIGGSLTNWGEIRKRLNRLEEIATMKETGELAKFTKRERLMIDREAADLELMFGGLRGMTKIPDALFIVDPRAEMKSVAEAKALNIPVIALLNSDCSTESITYPIPANDASRETIQFVLAEVSKAYSTNLGAKPQETNGNSGAN